MKHLTVIAAACLMVIAGIGCRGKEKGKGAETKPAGETAAKCPACGMAMAADAYCAKCNAVASDGKMSACPMCKKAMKAGTYCAACNSFAFDLQAKCPGCGAAATKGTFCKACKMYAGLGDIGYCEKCKKPFPKATGCPVCGKPTTQPAG